MIKVIAISPLIFSVCAFANLANLEKKLNEQVDMIYCSAILEYVDSDKTYDHEKSLKLIKNADAINNSLYPEQRVNVIQVRKKYMKKLQDYSATKGSALELYEHLKCDLKV